MNLGTTANFVILSGAAITTTGGGIITGNIGASPIAGSAIGVSCAQVIGIIYAVDASGPPCAVIDAALLTTAKGDLTTAYNDAAGRTPVPTGPFLNPNGGNIGGLNLVPGLYKFTTTTLITGADVTLTGGPDDVWIFQCAQDLQLGSGIKVILAGGARANNVFWQVGTSAVLGTSSDFKGTIMADQAITMNTSSTMEGRALAFSAGVTFNGTGAGLPVLPPVSPEIGVEQPPGTNLVDGVSIKDFGSVLVGTNASLIFTITNSGSADLTGLGITLDGADAAQFSVTANAGAPVSPTGSTTFTVRFTPTGTGLKTAALHIANNDSDENPFDITLTGTGTGVIVLAPEIGVEQPLGADIIDGGSKDFGMASVGANASLTFTIRNLGTADLTGLGITIDGADPAMFTVTANPTAPVGPSGSTTFTVRFAPTSTGVKAVGLHIANNDSDENPFDITLTATGVAPETFGSPITLNPQTGLFEQIVRVTNSSLVPVDSIRLVIHGLPGDVQVRNATGSTNGTPFVQYNFPLAPAAAIDFLIEYYRANRQAIPQPAFEVVATTPQTSNVTGKILSIDRNVQLESGRFLIEFSATPGSRYAVQYSSDMTDWKTANPTLTAPANRVQWYDDGPPKTESKPTSGSRFYRVIQLP